MNFPITTSFPSPAQDYVEEKLDLNKRLIKHSSATFFMRVEGDAMIGAGIFSGDILVVDRAIEPSDGKVVIAAPQKKEPLILLWRDRERKIGT